MVQRPDQRLDRPRAVAVLQQLRPGPRHRDDGLGPALRHPVRLRRRHLQRDPERVHRHQRLQGCRRHGQLQALRAPGGSWLQHLNIGGSVDAGKQDNPSTPQVLRTNVAISGNFDVGPEFLAFNNNVREFGYRAFWDLHLAYYYRHLSLIAEWQSGFQDYALSTQVLASSATNSTQPPRASSACRSRATTSWPATSSRARPSAAGACSSRIRDFDLRTGKFGLGALELAGRYNPLNFGHQVFTGGLADPNLWTNKLYTIDLGVNWYWTQYLKVSLGWQHAVFGNPVTYAPNLWQTNSNEAILRMQIYF